jgi:hypothetical protein
MHWKLFQKVADKMQKKGFLRIFVSRRQRDKFRNVAAGNLFRNTAQ